MTDTIRLYNTDEVQAIVEAAIADTLAETLALKHEAIKALKREHKRTVRKRWIIRKIKEFVVLGLPVWGCLLMVIHWVAFGY